MDGYITILNIIERLIKKDEEKENNKQEQSELV